MRLVDQRTHVKNSASDSMSDFPRPKTTWTKHTNNVRDAQNGHGETTHTIGACMLCRRVIVKLERPQLQRNGVPRLIATPMYGQNCNE